MTFAEFEIRDHYHQAMALWQSISDTLQFCYMHIPAT